MTNSFPEAKLRIRMSSRDAHYAGNLVDGAAIGVAIDPKRTFAWRVKNGLTEKI